MFEGGSGQVGLMFHYAPDGQRYQVERGQVLLLASARRAVRLTVE
jgi:hypothetical protein